MFLKVPIFRFVHSADMNKRTVRDQNMFKLQLAKENEQKKLRQAMVINAIRYHGCRKVKEVVDNVQKVDKAISAEDIRDVIQRLKREDKIILVGKWMQGSLFKRMIDISASPALWLTIIVTALTLMTIYLTPQVQPWTTVRFVAGGAFVLFIPGYSIIQLLFPEKDIDSLERLALTAGLGLAVTPLVGLLLSYAPLGMRLDSIVAFLGLTTIAMSFAGTYRKFLSRQKLSEKDLSNLAS